MTNEQASLLTADQAVLKRGYERAVAYVCPYPDCGVFAQHHWGEVANLAIRLGNNTHASRQVIDEAEIVLSACEACKREVIFRDIARIWPRSSMAPKPNANLPEDVLPDFNEARLIHQSSPRGAAALLRLALQRLMPHLGATKTGINDAIAELVASGTIPATLQQALDAVRVIGNEAVHPGELDLRDDQATVLSLFGLVNFIVEKAITEPNEIAALYGGLPPSKLEGIERRDAKPAEPTA